MTTLTVHGDRIVVRFSVVEKLLGLVRDHEFPLSAVTSVRVAAEGLEAARGVRAPGLGMPGIRKIGTWRGRGRTLVSVRRHQPAVVLDLAGERFAKVVIGTDDAEGVAAGLESRA